MRRAQFTDFHTAHYKIRVSRVYGEFTVIRRCDNARVQVIHRGWQFYCVFKRFWRYARKDFDIMCITLFREQDNGAIAVN